MDNNVIQNIIKILPEVLNEESKVVHHKLRTLLAGEMDRSPVSKDWINAQPYDDNIKAFPLENMTWSLSDRLSVKTGEYLKSFMPKDKNTLSNAVLDSNGLKIDFGTKLNRLHETGGIIKATPYSNIKTKKSSFLMATHFWKNYYLSNNMFFKIMALSVMKKGSIKVKKRPHFNPAIEKFKSQADLWLNTILEKILNKANG